jgi:hypothetical protein
MRVQARTRQRASERIVRFGRHTAVAARPVGDEGACHRWGRRGSFKSFRGGTTPDPERPTRARPAGNWVAPAHPMSAVGRKSSHRPDGSARR